MMRHDGLQHSPEVARCYLSATFLQVWRLVLPAPFSVPDQHDPFYKPIPESHEQARNIMADCKTQEFIDALEDKGVEPRRRSTGRGFTGIALKVRTPK